MKSAEEWQSEIGLEPLEFDEVAKLIRSVQTDAIKAAAEMCAPDRKDRDFVPGSFWEKLEREQRARILSLLPPEA